MKFLRFSTAGEVLSGVFSGGCVKETGVAGREFRLDAVKILAPVVPSKIVCVGLNYRDHALELGMAVPDEPVLFIKPSTAVIGPSEAIIYPRSAGRVDYEAELGVVIKSVAKDILPGKAVDHIAGYTCVNDVTARDIQKKDVQWTRAKSFDTFAPIGPWIETELDTADLRVRSYLNGALKQDSGTAEFIFDIPHLVSFISSVMTLLPGDIIATGTPPGVGPMQPGDEITIEVQGIGRLVNRVERQA